MKKFVLAAMAVLLMSTNAFAYTENWVTKDVSVRTDSEIKGSSAPALVIDECYDFNRYTGKVYFSLILTNSEWLYEGSGSISNGIEYHVITSSEMIVSVDTDVYDAENLGITIPLYTKVTEKGVAAVTIDPKESPLSAGTYIFAHSSYPAMDIKLSASEENTSAFNISIEDDYPYQVVAGRIYELKLTNGFAFTGTADVKATGKYAGITEFAKGTSTGTAYIKLEATSGIGSGTIDVTNIGIEPTEKSTEGEIQLSISAINTSGFSKTVHLGSYNPDKTDKTADEAENTESTDMTDDKNTNIYFTVGSQKYYINGIMYKTDAAPYINSEGRTMVPLRAAANALGITDDEIQWHDDGSKYVKINHKGTEVIIPAGASGDKYIQINGKKTETDSAAEIKDSRTFLPIRSLSNALGIDNNSITWDDVSKVVTIIK